MPRKDPYEAELLEPTRALFGTHRFLHAMEVPIGWRKIDFVATERCSDRWVAVELKISDWKEALAQANLNHLVADRTFVALWHRHLGPAMRHRDWFEQYRVGLISVNDSGAQVLFEFEDNEFCERRQSNRDHMLQRMARREREAAGGYGPVPVLSA